MSSPVEKLKIKVKSAPKLMIGESQMTVETDDLDEYHREKAERELRETPELVQESLKVLIDMLAGSFISFNLMSVNDYLRSQYDR